MKEPKLSMPTTYTDEMTKNELRKELATIKSEFNTAETDYTKAAEKQYLQYARWYLHWRKLSDSHSDFLKEEYDANNLSSLRKSDNVEFRRFVSYSLGIPAVSNTETNKITHYTYLLQGLHREISNNKEKYATKAIDKIVELLTEAGGKHKFVDAEKAVQQAEGTGVSLTPQQLNAAQKKAKKLAAAAKQIAQANLQNLKSSAVHSKSHIEVQSAVETDEDELVVFVGKRKKTGGFSVLATTNDADIINQILSDSITHNFPSLPLVLRQLAELFIIQHYPNHAKPNGLAQQHQLRNKILLEQSNLTTAYMQDFDDAVDERVQLASPPRLLFRAADNEIILSNTRTKVGLFISCKPKNVFYADNADLFLKTESRLKFDEWFDTYALQQISAEPNHTLRKVDNQKHQYVLDLHNAVTDEKNTFYFYDKDLYPSNDMVKSQSYFQHAAYEPVWRMRADFSWIKSLTQKHFDEWFAENGYFKQIKRDNNKTHVLCLSEHLFEIHFNFDNRGIGAVSYFDADIKIAWDKADTQANYIQMEFKSKDLATALYNMSLLPITSDVFISGNKHALVIEYKTKMGSYTLAVPVVDEYLANTNNKIHSLFVTV